jgi:hypothetical protein
MAVLIDSFRNLFEEAMKRWIRGLIGCSQAFIAPIGVGLICKSSLAQVVVPIEPVVLPPGPPIILGQPKEKPFVVVIPTSDFQTLTKVQQYAPLAFMSQSRLGSYIQAGAFADLETAQSLSYELRHRGFDAHVAYLRIRER